MRGFAGTLAKMTGNSLWGQFVISPVSKKKLVRKSNGGRESLRLKHHSSPRALDLAEHLTGSVRAQLFRLAIEAGENLICAHTDGAWVQYEPGMDFDGWRVKNRTREFRYLDAQRYSYRHRQRWEHSVSGFPREKARAEFEYWWTYHGGGVNGRSDRFRR